MDFIQLRKLSVPHTTAHIRRRNKTRDRTFQNTRLAGDMRKGRFFKASDASYRKENGNSEIARSPWSSFSNGISSFSSKEIAGSISSEVLSSKKTRSPSCGSLSSREPQEGQISSPTARHLGQYSILSHPFFFIISFCIRKYNPEFLHKWDLMLSEQNRFHLPALQRRLHCFRNTGKIRHQRVGFQDRIILLKGHKIHMLCIHQAPKILGRCSQTVVCCQTQNHRKPNPQR